MIDVTKFNDINQSEGTLQDYSSTWGFKIDRKWFGLVQEKNNNY